MICGASRWYRAEDTADQHYAQNAAMRLALAELIPVIEFDHTYQMVVTEETVPSAIRADVSEYRVLIRIEDMTR